MAVHRLEKSHKALQDAEILLKHGGTPSGVLTMGLRAAKEAAEATLVATGNETLRADSLLFLVAQFVRDGRLSQQAFSSFRTIMDLCRAAVEQDFSAVSPVEAKAALDNVKYFVREMGEIVKH